MSSLDRRTASHDEVRPPERPATCQPIPYGGNLSEMIRSRALVWLIALIAFIAPPLGTASMAHAAPPWSGGAVRLPRSRAAAGLSGSRHGQACRWRMLPLDGGCGGAFTAVRARANASAIRCPAGAIAVNLTGLTFTQDPPPPQSEPQSAVPFRRGESSCCSDVRSSALRHWRHFSPDATQRRCPKPSRPIPPIPQAPVSTAPYRPVLAGTAAHVPVGLKPGAS